MLWPIALFPYKGARMNVTYFGALVAGLLSFLSPCVLPLVPPHLCFLGGTTFDQLAGEDAPSFRNIGRAGFRAAYARPNLVRAP